MNTQKDRNGRDIVTVEKVDNAKRERNECYKSKKKRKREKIEKEIISR